MVSRTLRVACRRFQRVHDGPCPPSRLLRASHTETKLGFAQTIFRGVAP
jgi:hypothetical protein